MGRHRPRRQPVMRAATLTAKGKQRLKPHIATAELVGFRRKLLAWYDASRRDLPWRRTRDPYRIWLSEVMLQQTRVAAVIEHYHAFLERFPNLATLAAASEEAVLASWSGLGYYRRARMLHHCARELVHSHGGRFPRTAESLRALPGIGPYTAAAIASFAFHQPAAVVDGNVERVLSRLGARRLTPSETWQRAQFFLSPSRPGDFNQAMMELGATVCPPRDPRCQICPVRQWCSAQGKIAVAKPTTRQQRREVWCLLHQRGRRIRLIQRPKTVPLMAGMWELPQWANLPHPSAGAWHWRTFRHSITVTDYTVHVLRNWPPKGALAGHGEWIAIDQIAALPITGLTRKILRADGII